MFLLSTTVDLFSNDWFLYNGLTAFLITILIIYLAKCSSKFIEKFNKILAFIFFIDCVVFHTYTFSDDTWFLTESLPFHLCSIMWFNAMYFLLFKKQWSFELMLFIGMPAAFHSLLTPHLNHGDSIFYIFDFFFTHC